MSLQELEKGEFWMGQLKALNNRMGKHIEKKKPSIITTEMEERVWANDLTIIQNMLVYLTSYSVLCKVGWRTQVTPIKPKSIANKKDK